MQPDATRESHDLSGNIFLRLAFTRPRPFGNRFREGVSNQKGLHTGAAGRAGGKKVPPRLEPRARAGRGLRRGHGMAWHGRRPGCTLGHVSRGGASAQLGMGPGGRRGQVRFDFRLASQPP